MNALGNEPFSKVVRILHLYEKLVKGHVINKKEAAQYFGVNNKTIQRDMEEIKSYIFNVNPQTDKSVVEYHYAKKGYVLNRDQHVWLKDIEVLALLKVLLDSRAFTKGEMTTLLDKLITLCIPETRKHITELTRNERFHYLSIQNGRPLLQTIWDLSSAVKTKRKVDIIYKKETEQEIKRYSVLPLGIIFSEFYFYLIAYKDETDKFNFPIIYRLDRIENYAIQSQGFRVDEIDRFEEGVFRQRIQFMTGGNLINVKFKFWGPSLQAILDRLPTAIVVSNQGNTAVIEAKVYGRGIKMWLLSQAQYLEVIQPLDLRLEMKETIQQMLAIYQV